MKDICVIIPSLNPDEKLKAVVEALKDEGFGDIILVNDGSEPDRIKYFPKGQEITLLTHEVNRGKGAALKTAISYVMKNRPNALGAVTCDGDGQHTASDTKKVAQSMCQSGKFTLGVRDFSLDNVPARSRIGNRLSSMALLLCSGSYITDTQTGLRAIPAKLFEPMCKIAGDRFEYETNVLLELRSMNAEYSEVKIETVYLEENKSSHFRPFRDTVRIFSQMIKYLSSSLLSFITDTVLFTLFNTLAGAGIILSSVIARIFSSLLNFFLNKKMVFKSRTSLKKEVLKYYIIAIPTMLVSAFGTTALSKLLSIEEGALIITAVKIAVDIALYFINYRIQKKWVFQKD